MLRLQSYCQWLRADYGEEVFRIRRVKLPQGYWAICLQGIKMRRRLSLGQGMTEYIVIVALIALAAYIAFHVFGFAGRGQVANVGLELAGKQGQSLPDLQARLGDPDDGGLGGTGIGSGGIGGTGRGSGGIGGTGHGDGGIGGTGHGGGGTGSAAPGDGLAGNGGLGGAGSAAGGGTEPDTQAMPAVIDESNIESTNSPLGSGQLNRN